MTNDFDSLLKEAVILQKQKELDDFRSTSPMIFREKFSRRMLKLLQNSGRRYPLRQIIAVAIAALVLATCLGMALPEIRNSLRRPLLTVDRTFSAATAELNAGYLHRITGDSESGWIIESTDVYTGKSQSVSLPISGGEDISWKDLSVTPEGFTLLGRDSALRYLTVSPNGELLHDLRLPEVDRLMEDEFKSDFRTALAGEMVVFSYYTPTSAANTCNLHIVDPVQERHRYIGANIVTFCTSGEYLYFITKNNMEAYSPGLVHPYTLYVTDSILKDARQVWDISLPFSFSRGEQLGYDADTGILYFPQNFTLAAANLKTGKYGIAMDVGVPFSILGINDGIILYEAAGTFQVCRIPDGYFDITNREQLTALRIAEPGILAVSPEAYSDVFRTMWEDNHNLYGTYVHTPDYENTILEKLERGDDDFDIFYLDSSMARLFEGKYLTDLTRYPILDSVYTDMLDGVKSLCTADGVTGLIPTSMYTMMMRRNTLLCRQEFAVPSLIGELIPLKNAAAPHLPSDSISFMAGSAAHTLLMPWFEQLSDNYREGNLTVEEAQSALTDLFTVAADFSRDPAVWTKSGASFAMPYLMCVQNKGTLSPLPSTWNPDAAPILKVNEDCAYTFSGTYFAVNPNSPHQKEAAVFLAYLTEYLRDPVNQSPETAQLYREYLSFANTADVYNIFKTQLADSIRAEEIPGYSSFLSRLTNKLTGGTISVQEAARQTLEYIDQYT